MCLTTDLIERASGFVFYNEINAFVYCCKSCASEFFTGLELEEHILWEHHDNKPNVAEVFIEDELEPTQSKDVPREISTTEVVEKTKNTSQIVTENERKPFGEEQLLTELVRVGTVEHENNDGDEFDLYYDGFSSNDDWGDTKSEDKPKTEPMTNTEAKSVTKFVTTSATKSSTKPGTKSSTKSVTKPPTMSATKSKIKSETKPKTKPTTKSKTKSEAKTRTKQPRKRPTNKMRQEPTWTEYFCEMCPKIIFPSLNAVRQHMKLHGGNETRKQCTFCDRRPWDYERHILLKHTQEKLFKCDICGSSFRSKSNRDIHKRMHTGERPYVCDICGEGYSSLAGKTKHEMRTHRERMPHPCTQCDRTFLIPSHLQEHIYAMHSTEKPYMCDECGKNFATKKYLRKHKLIHGERKYSCKHCTKKFKTSESRRGHERTVHKIIFGS